MTELSVPAKPPEPGPPTAPFAARAEESRGRRYAESAHPYRNAFQRDRDRIIHSAAFRRLEYKTQVFAYAANDYVRTRLTHTLEVSQISRSVARVLRLNEDLAEAIALSHDLGHPPFGHAGERALDECTRAVGGFNHNIQGLRIVDLLEDRYGDFPGLNLSFEVREAFAKHGSGRAATPPEFAATGPQPVLEAQIVDIVDEITYTTHDIDDGIVHARLTLQDFSGLTLWDEAFADAKARHAGRSEKILRHETVRRIVNRLVTDLIETSMARLSAAQLRGVDDVRRAAAPMAALSADAVAQMQEIESFLKERLYRNFEVVQMNQKADRLVRQLFESLVAEPRQLPPRYLAMVEREARERVVADYIAGMTDKFAIESHARMFA